MKIIKLFVSSFLLFLTSALLCVEADVRIAEASEIVGKWKLDYSSPRIEGERRKATATWEFRRNGTLTTTASDPRTKGPEFTISVNYVIKDGKIVADQAGRSRRITYTVIEKEGSKMVLFGGADAFLFFTKI